MVVSMPLGETLSPSAKVFSVAGLIVGPSTLSLQDAVTAAMKIKRIAFFMVTFNIMKISFLFSGAKLVGISRLCKKKAVFFRPPP